MPLFPESLQETTLNGDLSRSFVLKVDHCSSCPFSHELIDEDGDYLGNKCNISSCKYLLKDAEDNFPKDCPLRKQNMNIFISLKK